MLQRLKQIASYLPVLGVILLSTALPFHYGGYQRFSLYFLAVTHVLDYVVNQRWKNWKWSNMHWVYICQIAFFLLIPIWQIGDDLHTPILQRTIENYLPFLIFGICGIMGITDKLKIEYVAIAMILTSVGIIIYVSVLSYLVGVGSFAAWVDWFNIHAHDHINSHMILNLYWNFSIIMGLYLVLRSRIGVVWKSVMGVAIIPIAIAVCVSDGRTGLLTFIGIVFVTMLYCMFTYRKWWVMGIILGFAVCAVAFLSQHERFIVAISETNSRVYIWNVATELIKEKPLFGHGICSAREEFVERGLGDEAFYNHYAKSFVAYLQRTNQKVDLSMMHPHNAILETWMQFGIIGVVLLIGLIVFPLTMRLGKYQLFLSLCVFAFAMQSIFESLGGNLQPQYFCLMVLFWHYHYLNNGGKDISPTAHLVAP